MKKKRAAKMLFAVTDYLRDTRCLSLAARGAWMDILCALWYAEPRGSKALTLSGWAGEVGKPAEEVLSVLEELRVNHIAEFGERDGLIVIANRRMVREHKIIQPQTSSELGFTVERAVSLSWVLSQWKTIPGVIQPRVITESIQDRIARITIEHPGRDWWEEVFSLVRQSDFLRGLTSVKFQASLDWVLARRNLDKILAGNYANAPLAKGQSLLCAVQVRKRPDDKFMKPCGNPVEPGKNACASCILAIAKLKGEVK